MSATLEAYATIVAGLDEDTVAQLDALAACYAAHLAAWKANGRSTDGTMSKLQHDTHRATVTALRYAKTTVRGVNEGLLPQIRGLFVNDSNTGFSAP